MSPLSRLVACVLSSALVCSSSATDASTAILTASGPTLLNGATVVRSSVVFPGDRVQTGADALAHVTATGTSVLVMPNSQVQFSANGVEITRGGVKISTSHGMLARTGQVTAAPTGPTAKFEVTEKDGTVHVLSHQGRLTVSQGSDSTALAAGQEITLSARDKNKKLTALVRQNPGHAALSNTKILAIAGVATSAATAAFIGKGSSNASTCAVSPSSPDACK